MGERGMEKAKEAKNRRGESTSHSDHFSLILFMFHFTSLSMVITHVQILVLTSTTITSVHFCICFYTLICLLVKMSFIFLLCTYLLILDWMLDIF